MMEEIRIAVKGGYLIAARNTDVDYDGISIMFETSDGDIIDIVRAECRSEYDYDQTDVYCYENVFTEDFTRKFTVDHEDVYEAFGEKYNGKEE